MTLRPYTTDLPARVDLEFLTNSDKTFGVAWNHVDGTGVHVVSAVCTFELDVMTPPVNGEPSAPVRVVIDGYDPADLTGYLHADGLVNGIVMVTVRHGAWDGITERSGNYDLQAVSTVDDVTRILERGIFTITEGVT
jgi:hypothetical protein